jgi:hypothetical protein
VGRALSDPTKPLFGERAIVPFFLALPVLVLIAGGIWAFRARPHMIEVLERGEAEGRALAHEGHPSPSDCLDGAVEAMDRYGEPPEPPAAAFLEACLSQSGAPKTGGDKQSAPTRGALEAWARDECKARGREGDKHCARLMQVANVDPCRPPFAGQTHAALRWSCPAAN